MAGSTGPGIVDSLNEALAGGGARPGHRQVAPEGVRLVRAAGLRRPDRRRRWWPQSGATQDQATCVLHAVDKLFVADDAVLTQASGNGAIAEWPTAEHDKFAAAVKTCVPDDLAAKIVDA